MKKHSVLVGIFFVLLFFGLFLGDGKQWAIDVYGATLAIVVTIYSLFAQGGFTKKVPISLLISWVVVAIAVGVSTVFSDSIGYSVSWVVRLLSGALLYRVFYNASSSETEHVFTRALLIFVGVSAVLFVGVYTFPPYNFLPSMSLLGTNYGHSHFADLLVLVTPLLLFYTEAKGVVFRAVIILLYVVILYMTRARGAVLVVFMYTIISWYKSWHTQKRRGFVYGLFALALCGYVVATAILVFSPTSGLKKFIKSDPITNRVVYWRQAVDAFYSKPFFGSGPGTFSLSSIQKQRTPWVSSWFAHSAPLQILSELGVFGLVAFGWLLWVHGAQVLRLRQRLSSPQRSLLAVSMSLLLLYSCFEYVLDYFVVWMLFWATLGLLVGSGVTKEQQKKVSTTIFLSMALGVFYALWVSSFLVTLISKRSDVAFYLAPFDSIQTMMFLESKSPHQPSQLDVQLADLFHRKNPVVLDAISKLKERQGDGPRALLYAKRAAYSSPQNPEYYSRYFSLLAKENELDILGSEILTLSRSALPPRVYEQIDALVPFIGWIGQYYKDWMIPEQTTYANGYASLYYRLGIGDLRDMEYTEKLLILAKDIYPDLAYLHVELAAFYKHIKHDDEKAQEVLISCQRYESAAKQCKEQMSFPLYPPSEYKDRIL